MKVDPPQSYLEADDWTIADPDASAKSASPPAIHYDLRIALEMLIEVVVQLAFFGVALALIGWVLCHVSIEIR